MKDLGFLSYFLGLEVSSNFDGYCLSQAKYASNILSRESTTNNKIVYTSLKLNVKLAPIDDTFFDDPILYRQLVGSLVYHTVTCLDNAYLVHLVSQCMATTWSSHFLVVL